MSLFCVAVSSSNRSGPSALGSVECEPGSSELVCAIAVDQWCRLVLDGEPATQIVHDAHLCLPAKAPEHVQQLVQFVVQQMRDVDGIAKDVGRVAASAQQPQGELVDHVLDQAAHAERRAGRFRSYERKRDRLPFADKATGGRIECCAPAMALE